MKRTHRTAFALISFSFLALCLNGCADSISVEAPAQNVSAKSNIKSRNETPQIERKLFDNGDTAAKDAARDAQRE